jgi:hypothetical protein
MEDSRYMPQHGVNVQTYEALGYWAHQERYSVQT